MTIFLLIQHTEWTHKQVAISCQSVDGLQDKRWLEFVHREAICRFVFYFVCAKKKKKKKLSTVCVYCNYLEFLVYHFSLLPSFINWVHLHCLNVRSLLKKKENKLNAQSNIQRSISVGNFNWGGSKIGANNNNKHNLPDSMWFSFS